MAAIDRCPRGRQIIPSSSGRIRVALTLSGVYPLSASASGCYFWSAPSFVWPCRQEGRKKKRKRRKAAWQREDQLCFGKGQWGTPQPWGSLGVSSQLHSLAEHSHTHHSKHSFPWCLRKLLPLSPMDQRVSRGFGGQVLLPSCQHLPAQAAVGVISSSKKGAPTEMGKSCPWPAPSQALPADPHVP